MKRNDLQILETLSAAARYTVENIYQIEKLLAMLEAQPKQLNGYFTFDGMAGPLLMIQRAVGATQGPPDVINFDENEMELLRRFFTYRKERLEKHLEQLKVRVG